jgi:undecaprenyl-diphosphatase
MLNTADIPLLLKAAILGVVEGLTEFLPISSTGHLILAGSLLGWTDEKAKLFDVAIQTGAMLAVVWFYRQKLASVATGVFTSESARRFVINVAVAFLPAAVLGVVFGKFIKHALFKPVPVALAFIVGAFVIMLVEYRQRRRDEPPRVQDVDSISTIDALKLGIAQAFALIPGTSRSGATIIGGMLFGLSRKAATEFSFFLAIPIIFGATFYELYKDWNALSADALGMFSIGFIAAFVSAFGCVRWLLRYIASHDFTAFAWYRIGFGLLILVVGYSGGLSWAD